MYIAFWNIRVLVDPLRQAEIRNLIRTKNLCCVGIFETKALASLFNAITTSIASTWKWVGTYDNHNRGRIWFGWNPAILSFDASSSSPQAIHGLARVTSTGSSFCLSIVYGLHSIVDRRSLWTDLIDTSAIFGDSPWLVAGDFNAIRFPADRLGTNMEWLPSNNEFGEAIIQANLDDLRYSGCRYTWSSSSGLARKQSKIDRVLVNDAWSSEFSFSEAHFLPPGISDHSPMLVCILPPVAVNKPFKFFNFWMRHPSFMDIVQEAWESPISGHPMFVLCGKLRKLKMKLKFFNKDNYSQLSQRTAAARARLGHIQEALLLDSYNQHLATEEEVCLKSFSELRLQEEMFYRQKSRVQWMKEGDRNTKFFHSTVNRRHLTNRILLVITEDGSTLTEPSHIQGLFVTHFEDMLTTVSPHPTPMIDDIRAVLHTRLSPEQQLTLVAPVTGEEIKLTMFSLANGKAPGPDGFNADFFKFAWRTVGPLVIQAVQDFFSSGKLLHEINSTIVALVPKKPNASTVHDYRPISCCNTIYKCIAKILANRIAGVLPSIISNPQGAFVKGRRIGDNILLAQELFAGFHQPTYSPKCVLKIDFQKAYDTVSWDFLRAALQAFEFPPPLIAYLMACVTTPKFSISINGGLNGYFPSGRGLRQGDPLSAYLFTIVMEVFTGILDRKCAHPSFKHYWRCKSLRLSHLFFVDDVLLFAQADEPSLSLLKDSILLFST